VIRADLAIARLRRDLLLSAALKWGALLACVLLAILVELLHLPASGPLALGAIGVIWLVLSYRSVKSSRLAAALPMLIAAGEFEQAEQVIDEALRSFSIYRGMKLRVVHQLAVLRHTQRRYPECVLLCRAILQQRLGSLAGMARSVRLILADSYLELGDLRGAYDALSALYRQTLPLGEALELTAVQTEYLARIGAWTELVKGLRQKVELAELMPSSRSARVQAMLALAARKTGLSQWEQWLKRRAQLLTDTGELVASRPMLAELFG